MREPLEFMYHSTTSCETNVGAYHSTPLAFSRKKNNLNKILKVKHYNNLTLKYSNNQGIFSRNDGTTNRTNPKKRLTRWVVAPWTVGADFDFS